MCSCKKHRARPGQHYCKVCHARASKELRQRRKVELARLRAIEALHSLPIATINE